MKQIYYIFLFLLMLNTASLAQHEWVDLNVPMEDGRTVMAHAILFNEVYLIGGSLDIGTINVATNSVVKFSLSEYEWMSPPNEMNHNRIGATAVSYQNHIFVFGGKNEDDEYVEAIEVFNPARNEWQVVGELIPAREGLRAYVPVGSDTIYVSGGGRGTLGQYKRIDRVVPNFDSSDITVEIFEPDESTLEPSLPSERSYHSIVSRCDKVYLFGGRYSLPLNDNYTWNYDTWVWNLIFPLHEFASGIASCSFNDSLIALSGGRSSNGELSSLSFYNVNQDTIVSDIDDDLPIGRSGHIMIEHENKLFSFGGSFYSTEIGLVTLSDVLMWEGPLVDVGEKKDITLLPDQLSASSYPNPSNGDVTINISSNVLGETDVTIFNILGQVVKVWNFNSVSKITKLSWNGFANGISVPGGVYFVVVQQENERHAFKLLRLP